MQKTLQAGHALSRARHVPDLGDVLVLSMNLTGEHVKYGMRGLRQDESVLGRSDWDLE